MEFNNILQVTNYFSDKKVCKDYLAKIRWNGNVSCPHCGKDEKIYTMKHNFKCGKCRKQFSETKGTIFENSAVPLQKWFVAIWLFTSHKKGISSIQLGKDIGVQQRTAWFMMQRIRFAMETKSFENGGKKMTGVVQIDEMYVGGDLKNMHAKKRATLKKGSGMVHKTGVMGILDGKEVRAVKIPDTKIKTLKKIMKKEISKDATVVTDGLGSYRWAKEYYSKHVTVSHHNGQYVNKGFHTNSIEGFWSIFKRGVYGIYHHVSKKHLDRYVNEFEYRYNTRDMSESGRFEYFLGAISGKRIKYIELVSTI